MKLSFAKQLMMLSVMHHTPLLNLLLKLKAKFVEAPCQYSADARCSLKLVHFTFMNKALVPTQEEAG
jgi:hypothetical protein